MAARFVLASPGWLQYGLLGTALGAGLSGFAWVGARALEGPLTPLHALLGGAAFLVLLVASQPKLWRRWIHGVADRDGLWLPTRAGRFVRVPWADVGRIQRIAVRVGGVERGALRAYVNVDEGTWRQVSWRHPNDHLPGDPNLPAGFRPLRIGTVGHDTAAAIASLEALRAAHGADASGSHSAS